MSIVPLLETDCFDLSFDLDAFGELNLTMESKNLYIRSVRQDDLDNFYSLFSDPVVMRKFATGCTKDRDYCASRINRWVNKFRANNPFSGFSIFSKDKANRKSYVGFAVLGGSLIQGFSEYAVALRKEFWGKGLGSEVTELFLHTLAPAIKAKGYTVREFSFQAIEATARIDNFASNKMLQNAGMQIVEQSKQYGSMRNHYQLRL
ncbi:hypothetical protein COB11_04140 [Candidatus Aerophobetes bacterium]|uniref:N-acetyltransferase domain-containing protein n=1 Tax=Aerophobetes bacterium TaxID=2030807 RepID=A0A2A4YIB2_UNCAE|nr:MAG: hypothetical protein COB11_04140 [Candidatus Aerophobetes bacterium]